MFDTITFERAQMGSEQSTISPPVVSVIIPALNEEKVIEQCLNCLVRQTLRADQFEVIVVDNGSVDRTLEIARTFGGLLDLTIVKKKDSYISALRNLGAASANGQFVAFLDADCLAPPQWLSHAVNLLRCGDGGVVGSFYTVPNDSSWLAKAWYEDMPRLRQGIVSYVPSGTLFVSRAVFLKVGGFDPTLQTSEDFEFCQRVAGAGYRVLAFPELSTVHLGTPQTLWSFYRKQRWHGNGVRTVFLRNKLHLGFAKTVLQTGYTLFWMLAAVVAVPIGFLSGHWALLGIAPALLVLSSLVLAVSAITRGKNWKAIGPLTIIYLVYGIARAVSLVGLTGKRTVHPSSASICSSCAGDVQAR